MTPTLRTLRAIDIAATVGLAAAAVIAFWPASVRLSDQTVRAVCCDKPVPTAQPDTNADASTVVTANILSSSRHAPATRYASPDLQSQTPYIPPAAFAVPTARDSATDASNNIDTAPAVYGIMNMNGAWHALVRLNAADVNPVLLQEGDKRGAFRIISISADRVIVEGPAGQRTLKLSRTQRADSTGHKP